MTQLHDLCITQLETGSYNKIDKLVMEYRAKILTAGDDAETNDYETDFHLVLNNAIERYTTSKIKDEIFAAWICKNILDYYGNHIKIDENLLTVFNTFIKQHYSAELLTDNVLIALYSGDLSSLEIIADHISSVNAKHQSPHMHEEITHIIRFSKNLEEGPRKDNLIRIINTKLAAYIASQEQDASALQNIINKADELKISCPTEAKKKSYRNRLMLGEADFGYTAAVLKKHNSTHPELGKSITSTEYLSQEIIFSTYSQNAADNINLIKKNGGEVFANIDARKISSYPLPHKRYPRVHFNFPHDKSEFKARTLPAMLKAFFDDVRKIQEIHDRVHIALPTDRMDFYHAYIYEIYEASARAGYQLVKKRRFDDTRYPGYKHCITGKNDSAKVTEKGSREFIFEKTNYSYQDLINTISPPRKKYIQYDNQTHNYPPHIDTDSGSSDYMTDEELEKRITAGALKV